ncbi:sensor histidine kinase [Nocardioides astragali]|uniref:histidine kinase n=1 Tax=Nocardioides astragali TaxID=1776736 RepID=A0ABW2N446_9ACTN|nr:ATP-binding protein [Nocardioides astragali]
MNAEHLDPAQASAGLGDATIAESSQRYASLFTYHPHAAYSVDRRGYYTDANPRALEMTGLSLQQMRETHFSQVIHPEDLHIIQGAFDGAMTGETQLVEARVLRDDGEVIDIRCTAIPVVVGGEVVGVHGIAEDVTAAKQVVRQLEEANAAKTLFLATVSHEIRTPLAVLVGATDLLMDAELEPEPAHYADMVHRSSQRLMGLVDDILEFSGLEAHQTVLHPRPFEPRSVVDEVAEWAVPLAESRNLTISFVVDESVPATAVGDPRRVTQVVTNLVQNAITYTESGSIDVRVRSRAAARTPDDDAWGTGSWVEFAVADTGVGIAEDHAQALFDPFIQADPRPAIEHRGVGLGLAICRELVDLMGGQLRVLSTVGEGSTFVFGLPLGDVADDSDVRARTSSAG